MIDELVSGKRPRRTTPVKQRAAKMGVDLPPTPSGIREALATGDKERKQDARRQLQRHQKACHQKVDRAETAAAGNPGLCHYRNQALARDAKKRSWDRHKTAWLENRKARKRTDSDS